MYLTKLSASGDVVWTKLFGSSGIDEGRGSTIGLDGSIYVAGIAGGAIDGQSYGGGYDGILSKFDSSGTRLWTRLIGSGGLDHAWTATTGLDGSIYVGGVTYGALDGQANAGGPDGFLIKYSPEGTKLWTRLLGTGGDEGINGITVGLDGAIYASGSTNGSLDGQFNEGGNKTFIAKFNSDGTKVWTSLQGVGSTNDGREVATGPDGAIFLSGNTGGALDGQTYSGGVFDAFLTKFSPATPQITFDPGASSATLVVNPTPDTIAEGSETVVVNVLAGTGYTIDRGTATGRIVDTVDPRFKGIEDDDIRINGVSIGAIGDALTADDRLAQMQDAINAQTLRTGVSAAFDPATGGLSLTAADGRNIEVSTLNNAGVTGAATGIALQSASGTEGRTLTTFRSGVDLLASGAGGITVSSSDSGAVGSGLGAIDAPIALLTTAQIAALGTAQLAAMTSVALDALVSAQFAALGAAQVAALTNWQVASLEATDLAAISTVGIAALGTAAVSVLRPDEAMALGTAQMRALTTGQIAAITTRDTAVLSSTQIAALSTAQVAALGTSQLLAMVAGKATPASIFMGGQRNAQEHLAIQLPVPGLTPVQFTPSVVVSAPSVSTPALSLASDPMDNITLRGTPGSDVLNGTSGPDTIFGDAGNDTLKGYGGDDYLMGGDGSDRLFGGDGNDTLVGGNSKDRFWGDAGDDSMLGGNGDDNFNGDPFSGNDTMDGGTGKEWLDYGGATAGININFATGTVIKQGGVDTIRNMENLGGTNFADTIIGSSGNEWIEADQSFWGTSRDGITQAQQSSADYIDAGAGWDGIGYGDDTAGVYVNLKEERAIDVFGGEDTLKGFEEVDGSNFNDTIIGSDGNNWIQGDAASWGIGRSDGSPSSGDYIDGGLGVDTIAYYDDNRGVTVNLQTGRAIDSFGGEDTLVGFEAVQGSSYNDTLIGDSGNNTLEGGGGNDSMFGGDGRDSFRGDASGGSDTMDGGSGKDWLSYGSGTAGVNANLQTGTVIKPGGTDTIRNIENFGGTNFADTIIGTSGADWFEADQSYWGASRAGITQAQQSSADYIDAGLGTDGIGYGDDFAGVTVNLKTERAIDVFGGQDTIKGVENVDGSNFGDTIIGSDGGNWISGDSASWGVTRAAGSPSSGDYLDGGAGRDTVSYMNDTAGVTVNLQTGLAIDGFGGQDTLKGFEMVEGSSFNDLIIGDGGKNYITGLAGNDTLYGGDGHDTIDGGDGNDLIFGGAGDDSIIATSGSDTIDGGSGSDSVLFDIGNYRFDGLNLRGDPSNGWTLKVQDGTVIGSFTPDLTTGIWTFQRNDGLPTSSFSNIETIQLRNASGAVINIAMDNTSGMPDLKFTPNGPYDKNSMSNVPGYSYIGGIWVNDSLTGSAGNDSLVGGDYSDTLFGSAGNDTLDGGMDSDTLSYQGADNGVVVNLVTGVASSDGMGGTDVVRNIEKLFGSDHNDTIVANRFASVWGGAGDDVLMSGDGTAYLVGDTGNDTLIGSDSVTDRAGYKLGSTRIDGMSVVGDSATAWTVQANGSSLLRVQFDSNQHQWTVQDLRGLDAMQDLGTDVLRNMEVLRIDGVDGSGNATTASIKLTESGTPSLEMVNRVAVGNGNANGTNASEYLFGSSSGSGPINGGGGNDTIATWLGGDTLVGGAGDDYLDGGSQLYMAWRQGNLWNTLDDWDTASYTNVSTGGVRLDLSTMQVYDLGGSGTGTDTLRGIEMVNLTRQHDEISGDFSLMAGNNELAGNTHEVDVAGFGGSDTFDLSQGIKSWQDVWLDYSWSKTGISVQFTGSVGTVSYGEAGLVGSGNYQAAGADTLIRATDVGGTSYNDLFDFSGLVGGMAVGAKWSWADLSSMGNDTVIGNGYTGVSFNQNLSNANGDKRGVTVQMGERGQATTVDMGYLKDQSGKAAGYASLQDINEVSGTNLDDVLIGNSADNFFQGRGGWDVLDGGSGGIDTAIYRSAQVSGITVNLKDGLVYSSSGLGTNVGQDTLRSIEVVRGSNFGDVYDARGFSAASANAGSLGTWNKFIGGGGDDTIYGNGSTVLSYGGSGAPPVAVEVNLGTGIAQALDAANRVGELGTIVGTDTFTGVYKVEGSALGDRLITGSAGGYLEGGSGNDTLVGGSGSGDVAVYTLDGISSISLAVTQRALQTTWRNVFTLQSDGVDVLQLVRNMGLPQDLAPAQTWRSLASWSVTDVRSGKGVSVADLGTDALTGIERIQINGTDSTGDWTRVLTLGEMSVALEAPTKPTFGAGDIFMGTYQADGTLRRTLLTGTLASDQASAAATALDGSLYLTGTTQGNLAGQTGKGGQDGFVSRYDAAGNALWTRLIGSSASDSANAVSASPVGGVVVAGSTAGSLNDQSNQGGSDAFITRYADDGSRSWTTLIGSTADDSANGVAVGKDGAVYAVGRTAGDLNGQNNSGADDAFITQLTSAGSVAWTRLIGTSGSDVANAVSTGADGAVYVVGSTAGSVQGQVSNGGTDGFLSKFGVDGTLVWSRQIGTAQADYAQSVVVSADGFVYVAGATAGALPGQSNSGGTDGFLSKYSPNGTLVWTRQIGSAADDFALAVRTDADGSIYVSGTTQGDLNGEANAGGDDAFLTKFSPDGVQVWSRLNGVDGNDWGSALAITPARPATLAFNTAQIAALTAAQINAFGAANLMSGFTTEQLAALTTAQIGALSVASASGLSVEQFSALGSAQIAALSTSNIAALTLSEIIALTPTQAAALTTPQVLALSGQSLSNLENTDLAALGTSQIAALRTSQFNALSSAQLPGLRTSQIAALTSAQLVSLSTASLNALTPQQFAALGTTQAASLTTRQIARLDAQDFAALSTSAVAALSTAAIAVLSRAEIIAITTAQTAALGTAQVQAIATRNVSVMESRDIRALSNSQIAALTTAQVVSMVGARADALRELASASDGSIILGGYTEGNLDGLVNNAAAGQTSTAGASSTTASATSSATTGTADGFLTKYAADGSKVWSRLIGGSGSDWISATTRGAGGTIIAAGRSDSATLDEQTNNGDAGTSDGFLTVLESDGTKKWSRLIGGTGNEQIRTVTSAADGTIFVAGVTDGDMYGQPNKGGQDVFIAQYSADGTKLWSQLVGSASDDNINASMRGPNGSLILVGTTGGGMGDGLDGLGGQDGFIVQLAGGGFSNGRLIGSGADDSLNAVAGSADGSFVVGGSTWGSVDGQTNRGGQDGLVAKFAANGTKLWSRLIGSNGDEEVKAVAITADGSILAGGSTWGNLDGQANAGWNDAFITKFAADGTKLWTRLIGSDGDDSIYAITTASDGSFTVSGYTDGSSLDGQATSGSADGFVAKYAADGTKLWTRLVATSGTDWVAASTPGDDAGPLTGGSATILSLSTSQITALSTAQINALGAAKLMAGFATEQIAALTTGQVSAMSTASLTGLSNMQIAAIGTAQLAVLTTAQIIALPSDSLNALGTAQFQALTTTQAAALTTQQVAALETADFAALGTSQIAALSIADMAVLSTAEVVAFTTAQVRALTTAQIQALSTRNVAAMESGDLRAMTTSQIAALTVAQVMGLVPAKPAEVQDFGVVADGSMISIGTTPWEDGIGRNGSLTKFDASGNQVWTRLLDSGTDDYINGFARRSSDGSVIAVGATGGNLDSQVSNGGYDGYMSKYSADGTRLWTRLVGTTEYDALQTVIVGSSGSIVVGGLASGDLYGEVNNGPLGYIDGLVAKYAPDGTKLWSHLIGGSATEWINTVALGSQGSILVEGLTSGVLDGLINPEGRGEWDYKQFMAQYSADGTKLWTRWFNREDWSALVAAGSADNGPSLVLSLTTTQVTALTATHINALGAANLMYGFATDQVAALTTGQISALSTTSISGLSGPQFSVLSAAQIVAITTTNIAALTTIEVVALTTAQAAALTTAQIGALTTQEVASVEAADLAALTTAQLVSLSANQAKALNATQTAALTTSQVFALTTAQIAALATASLNALSAAQFQLLNTAQAAALTTQQVAALETTDFAALGTSQIAALSIADMAVLSTAEVVAFTTAQVRALTTAQIQALSTRNVAAMESGDLQSLTTGQVASLTAAQVVGLTGGGKNNAFVYGANSGWETGLSHASVSKFTTNGAIVWTRLIESSGSEEVMSVSMGPDGLLLVGGNTNGNLDGQSNKGGGDGFLAAYSADGARLWTRLIGTTGYDVIRSTTMAIDGSVLVSGHTSGNLDGQANNGSNDGFLTKFSADGTRLWTRLIGGPEYEWISSTITARDGSVLVSGRSGSEGFLAKYNPDGTQVWTRPVVTSGFSAYSLSSTTANDDSVVLSGATTGNLDGQTFEGGWGDGFLTKYSADGSKLWTRLIGGGGYNVIYSTTIGGDGSVLVSGRVDNDLHGQNYSGGTDGFVVKYSADGTRLWTRLIGTVGYDEVKFTRISGDGSIYAVGSTGKDVFATKFDADGNRIWTRLFESSGNGNSSTSVGEGSRYFPLHLSTEGVAQLTAEQIEALFDPKAPVSDSLPSGRLAWLTTSQIASMNALQINAIGLAKLMAGLTTEQIASLTTAQISALSTASASGFSAAQFSVLSTAQIVAITTTNIAALNTLEIVALTTAQAVTLTTAQAAALTTQQVAALETADFAALGTAQIAALSITDMAVLSTAEVVALTTAQVRALTTAQVQALSTNNVAAMESGDLRALTTSQIGVLTTSQVVGLAGIGKNNAFSYSAGDPWLTGTPSPSVSKYMANGVIAWTRLIETNGNIMSTLMATDGSVLVGGSSFGYGVLSNYSADGAKLWTKRLDGPSWIQFTTSARDGSILVSGNAYGDLNGQIGNGGGDLFLSNYSAAGTHLWTRLIGGSGSEWIRSILKAGDGAILVTGSTSGDIDGQINDGGYNNFLTKYSVDGTRLWTQLVGWSVNYTTMASDGSVVVTGSTDGNLDDQVNQGGHDGFLTKYSADGIRLWTRLIGGSGTDGVSSITTASDGSVLVSGYTDANLDAQVNNGGYDGFLTKYSADGIRLWTRLIGGTGSDWIQSTTTATDGSVLVSGNTDGNLDGQTNHGGNDGFLTKYSADGTRLWTRLVGTSGAGWVQSTAVASDGSVFALGSTYGNLDGQINVFGNDTFIVKFDASGNRLWTRLLNASRLQNLVGTDSPLNLSTAYYALTSTAYYPLNLSTTSAQLTGDQIEALFDPYNATNYARYNAQLSWLTTTQIAALSASQINAIGSAGRMGAFGTDQVAALTTVQINSLNTANASGLSSAQFSVLSVAQIVAITTSNVAALTTAEVVALTTAQAMALTAAQIGALTTQAIASLQSADLAVLTTAQLVALSASQAKALSGKQTAALTTSQVFALTTAQIAALATASLNALSAAQLQVLNTAQAAALTTQQVASLETTDFAALGTSQIAALSIADMAVLSTAEVVAFTTAQVRALTTAQIQALSTRNVAAMESGDLRALSTAQVAALTAAQVVSMVERKSNSVPTLYALDHGMNISKYSLDGTWIQLPSIYSDYSEQAIALAVSPDGVAYMGGTTYGNLGGVRSGGADAFVVKYGVDGSLVWVRQSGASGADAGTGAFGVTQGTDGSAYIVGWTNGSGIDGQPSHGGYEGYVTRYESDGTKAWTRMIGTEVHEDARTATAGEDGSVYITGHTDGSLDGEAPTGNAFLTKYAANGNRLWTRLIGSSDSDLGAGGAANPVTVAQDGSVFFSGFTYQSVDGQPAIGGRDIFLAKYRSDGTKEWTRLIGSSADDDSRSVTADADGSVYVSGYTHGNFGGQLNSDGKDAFITKFSSSGELLWSRLIDGQIWSSAISPDGTLYVNGSLGSEGYVSQYDSNGTLLKTQNIGSIPDAGFHGLPTTAWGFSGINKADKFLTLTTTQIAVLASAQINAIGFAGRMFGFTTEQVLALTTGQISSLSAASASGLSSAQFSVLSAAQIVAINTINVAALTTAEVVALSTAQAMALTAAQIGALTTQAVASLQSADLAALSTAQLVSLSATQAKALSGKQTAALTTSQVFALTTAQIAALATASLNALSAAQFQLLHTAQAVALTTQQVAALETTDFAALGTAQIAALSIADMAVLSTAEVVAFTTAQVRALTTAQMQALSTRNVAAMESGDLRALSTAQVASLTAAQVLGLVPARAEILPLVYSASETLSVQAASGPWSSSLNPSFAYTSDAGTPTVISLSSLGVSAGQSIGFQSLGGNWSLAAWSGEYETGGDGSTIYWMGGLPVDPANYVPGYSTSPSPKEGQLLGVFTNDGVIVGSPFIVSITTNSYLVPIGANQIQFGVNDSSYSDNAGFINLKILSQGSSNASIALTTTQITALTATQINALGAANVMYGLATDQVQALTTGQINTLSTASASGLSAEQFALLSTAQVVALTTGNVAALTTAEAVALTTTQAGALTTAQVVALNTADVVSLRTSTLVALSNTQVAALRTGQMAVLLSSQTASLRTNQLAALLGTQVASLSTSSLNAWSALQFAALTTTQITALTTTQAANLETADFAALSAPQVQALRTTTIAALSTNAMAALSTAQAAALTTAQIFALTRLQMIALEATDLAALSTAQIGAFTTRHLAALGTTQVAALGTAQVRALGTTPFASLSTANLNAMGVAQFQSLTTAHMVALTTLQALMLETVDFAALGTAQIAALSTAGTAALSTAEVAALSLAQSAALNTAQIRALGTRQIVALPAADLQGLSTAQLAALSTSQMAVLLGDQLAALRTSQLAALGTLQVNSLSSAALNAWSTVQFFALTTGQVAALNSAQMANLETVDFAALSTAQIQAITTNNMAALRAVELLWLVTAQAAALRTAQLTALSASNLSFLGTAQIAVLNTANVAVLSTAQTAALTTAQVAVLGSSQILSLSTRNVATLTVPDLSAMSTGQIRAFTSAQVGALTSTQVSGLGTAQFAGLSTAQWSWLASASLNALSSSQFAGLGTQPIAALGTQQIANLETADFAALTTAQIVILSTVAVASLASAELAALSTTQAQVLTTTQMAALATQALGGMQTADVLVLSTRQVMALNTSQIVALGSAQVAVLSSAQTLALATNQIRALETVDLAVLGTASVRGLMTTQLRSLSTNQTRALTTTQVRSLSTSQLAALSTTQTAVMDFRTPIVLDLNGDGVKTLALEAGVRFDLAADGQALQTGWVSAQDGLLVRDVNHDGTINNGAELFGSSTVLADGSRANDGYQALAELDSNHDGVISQADTSYGELGVWVDGNSDGLSQRAEIHSLSEMGITQLSTQTTMGTAIDNGNILGLSSSYQTSDGASHAAADVWFQTAPSAGAGLAGGMSVQVSGLAQAIGAFDADDGFAKPGAGALGQPGLAQTGTQAASAVLNPAVHGLVDAMRLYKDQARAMELAAEPPGTLRSSQAVAPAALVDANEVSRRMTAQSVSAFAALPPQK